MEKIILSKIAGEASPYLRTSRPSSLIPFKGNFPLLDPSREKEYWEWMNKTDTLQDCPDWLQAILIKGQRIARIEQGFQQYLQEVGVESEFKSMKAAEKSTWLVRFLNANSMDIEALQIN